MVMSVQKTQKISVAMRPGETPVPIPNTMVKPWTADGTTLETVWESRWLPKPFKNNEPEGFSSIKRSLEQ